MDGDHWEDLCPFSDEESQDISIEIDPANNLSTDSSVASGETTTNQTITNDPDNRKSANESGYVAKCEVMLKDSSTSTDSSNDEIKKPHKIKFPYGKPRVIGNIEADEKVVRSMYITSCEATDEKRKKIDVDELEREMSKFLCGKVKLRETSHGVIVTFTREEDGDKFTKLNMSKIFGYPIAVWNIPQVFAKYYKSVLIRDIPWCISIKEVEGLLKCQGIQPLHVTRIEGSAVRVEVKNSTVLDKLINDGLNFYNCTCLPVVLESNDEIDVIQCYKCQRFWHTAIHCPFHVRCVRCGERHDVRDCLRSRKNPLCCLCGENHHAAYKFCPVRIQHLNSVKVDFSMVKNPPREP